MEKYAKDNRLPNPRFFFDDGYSGVTFARPAFTEILELAEQGLIENLVVKDHSRLGRNRLVVGQLLEEEFERLGIRYIAIMDNIDTIIQFAEVLKNNPDNAYDFICNNYHKMSKSELASIVKELLYAIHENCEHSMFDDIAIEIEDLYQQ